MTSATNSLDSDYIEKIRFSRDGRSYDWKTYKIHITAINRIENKTNVKVTLFSDRETRPINIMIQPLYAGIEQSQFMINTPALYHTARFEGFDIDNDFTIEQV